jgi:hypothetical protein
MFEYHSDWPVMFKIHSAPGTYISPYRQVYYRHSHLAMNFECHCGALFTSRTLMMLHRWNCFRPFPPSPYQVYSGPEDDHLLPPEWDFDYIKAPVPNSEDSYPSASDNDSTTEWSDPSSNDDPVDEHLLRMAADTVV